MRILIATCAAFLICSAPAAASSYHRCAPPLRIERRLDSRVDCATARNVATVFNVSDVEQVTFKVDGRRWECFALSNKVIACQHVRRGYHPLVRIWFRVNVA